MSLEYMQKYTDLRTGKMSFNQFMEFANEVFALGYEKGAVSPQPAPNRQINDLIPANRKCGKMTRIAYESVF